MTMFLEGYGVVGLDGSEGGRMGKRKIKRMIMVVLFFGDYYH